MEQLEKASVQQQKRQTFLADLHSEIDAMQTTLAQHNLIIDAVVAKTPLEALQRELQALVQRNDQADEVLQRTLEQRAAVEDATRGLQVEVERLQEVMAAQIEALPEQVRGGDAGCMHVCVPAMKTLCSSCFFFIHAHTIPSPHHTRACTYQHIQAILVY